MTTELQPTVEDDVKAVNDAFLAGRPIPPDVGARIDQRAAEIRERLLREHGPFNSVDLIRQDRETGH